MIDTKMQQKIALASIEVWTRQYLPNGVESLKLERLDINYMKEKMFVIKIDLGHGKIASIPLGFTHENELVIVANADFGMTYKFSKAGVFEYLFLAEINRQRRPVWEWI